MPAETKEKLKIYVILGVVIIVLAAALTVLILFLGKEEPEPVVETTTAPTETTEETTAPTVPTEPTLPQSSLTSADFTYDGEFLICPSVEYMIGIDVSHHQGDIDWAEVKEAGVDFVMVRLGYRSQSEEGLLKTDRYVQQNLQEAKDAGLLVGAYFYSQAVSPAEAVDEAKYALEILNGFPLDLPLAYDWEQEERTDEVGVQTLTSASVAFCNMVENAGYKPMLYFNSYQAKNLADMLQLQKYPWWLALYDTDATFPCRFDIWQYSCTGSVPGIEGNVDLNVMIVE